MLHASSKIFLGAWGPKSSSDHARERTPIYIKSYLTFITRGPQSGENYKLFSLTLQSRLIAPPSNGLSLHPGDHRDHHLGGHVPNDHHHANYQDDSPPILCYFPCHGNGDNDNKTKERSQVQLEVAHERKVWLHKDKLTLKEMCNKWKEWQKVWH